MNKRRIIRLAFFLIILCVFSLLRPKTGEVTLVNGSGEEVVKTTVEINGVQSDFAGIPPGGTEKITYKILPETGYSISVEFRYDRKLNLQTGVFTGGKKSGHQLIIKSDGVVLESGNE